ncbi:MAG: Trm112 family protein [Candidatus Omnitrophica bacterium]|nr:Trm112 family protein [Candidatus Omnitrophota bacterium]
MIDEHLLNLLACPLCQGDVELQDNKIVCNKCQQSYPIVDGIPILLVAKNDEHPFKKTR